MKQSEALLFIVNLVDKVRVRQELDGSIKEPTSADSYIINELISFLNHQADIIDGLSPELLAATSDDLNRWMLSGLNTSPKFDNTLAAFKAPLPDAPLFFLAPMRATNGPDPEEFRLELVTGYRCETVYLVDASKYTKNYIAPFQCIKMGIASKGFLEGNCLVLFPESVATAKKIDKQAFALFFFRKFFDIYNEQTIVEAERLLGRDSKFLFGQLSSRNLSKDNVYNARCLWGYYHDYAHHTGPRPLDKNLYIKLNWFTGLLEETKVDLITVRILLQNRPKFWKEISEFVLLERIFRYPKGSDKYMTFDAGTGIVLFEILIRNKALIETDQGYLQFDLERLKEVISLIIADIEALEALDDNAYLVGAKNYIQNNLGKPQTPKARFNFSTSYYARRVIGGLSH
ncbi:DUF6421 family protein [Bartonella sp. 220]|uniref:DUF6421 family protein n=1 Tax=Bartonella sp. 220B TaxID=2967260 RepID=UPI0022A92ED5|nr:DUF6421 family protein [Bartonella sp. 220B]MCZ2158592.1 DUF6421 family protein [Bartonella sp. 220B]